MRTSGYTDCACRDCFGLGISSDGYTLALCNECEDAGCDVDGAPDCLAPEDADDFIALNLGGRA